LCLGVGDNPSSDVKGANEKGWVSVFVKTGNAMGDEEASKPSKKKKKKTK